MIVTRGVYDEQNKRAITEYSGFVQRENNLYERFQEIIFNISYDISSVKEWLLEAGWKDVSFRKADNLDVIINDPEQEERVFIVAKK